MLWAHSTTGDYIWKHRKKEWTHWHGVEADVIIKEKATSHSPSDYYSDRWFKRILIISIIIYSLTARVVGAPQMISQPVSSIFPCSPLPSWTWRTPGLSIPWCCLPTSTSVCLHHAKFDIYHIYSVRKNWNVIAFATYGQSPGRRAGLTLIIA